MKYLKCQELAEIFWAKNSLRKKTDLEIILKHIFDRRSKSTEWKSEIFNIIKSHLQIISTSTWRKNRSRKNRSRKNRPNTRKIPNNNRTPTHWYIVTMVKTLIEKRYFNRSNRKMRFDRQLDKKRAKKTPNITTSMDTINGMILFWFDFVTWIFPGRTGKKAATEMPSMPFSTFIMHQNFQARYFFDFYRHTRNCRRGARKYGTFNTFLDFTFFLLWLWLLLILNMAFVLNFIFY